MNNNHLLFQVKLAQLRMMPDKSIKSVCEELGVSETARRRMMVIIRAENGQQTRIERFREIVAMVRARIGERDPQAVSQGEFVKALGISPNQFWRARSEILRERREAEADSQGPKLEPQGPKPARVRDKDNPRKLIWIEDGRLYSKNREPQEVGA